MAKVSEQGIKFDPYMIESMVNLPVAENSTTAQKFLCRWIRLSDDFILPSVEQIGKKKQDDHGEAITEHFIGHLLSTLRTRISDAKCVRERMCIIDH